ncbi:PREDICTED: uncharacterized protein LOC108367995 isoform X3 [Rhagoletis zephyria]|uniref:uncharacterized protein LOC108367995 isoform X1 n=1 Tax=Rhagoletis zephyria TaxID=28612 RepID=UPI0008116B89|nr:PREDICTED: uncharacterized protein LOC108367995 isoform X1 [Rhagoletis zephyria]XP_017478212.1 PREDICTED: uncharacterized protein LOC108367995 isoform X3 [Rhagoletis zephyria]
MACRLCLKKPGDFLEIFKESGELVEGGAKEIIEKYFQIQITFNDEISNKICLVCWRYLNEFHRFWLNIKEKQQTLQIVFDCMKIKREASKDSAYEINSTFDGKNNILCEPELIIDDIKGEPNLAGDFDDSMNEDSSLLLPKSSDVKIIANYIAIFPILIRSREGFFHQTDTPLRNYCDGNYSNFRNKV